ncbi:MAG: DNA/RNA non-specific endonuclease [Lachnospiraceae bacterium]|nr:DNA/RNA non-specific endonuclease [Lachnospiraceae bacterium]
MRRRILWIATALTMALGLCSCSALPDTGSSAGKLGSAISSVKEEDVQKTGKVSAKDWYSHVDPYNGTPYEEVNGNKPFFKKSDTKNMKKSFESYSPLDSLGRCGAAYANVGEDIRPTDERESISNVKPSGWKQKYINREPVYNRCHLIAYMLTGENDNPNNLITGTRAFNVQGMLPFEETVGDYLEDHPSHHVLYRVTPVFEGDDLVAKGVLMEAYSDDNGDSVQFCVFVYNNQDNVTINYKTGTVKRSGKKKNFSGKNGGVSKKSSKKSSSKSSNKSNESKHKYILNVNTRKFHTTGCSNAKRIKDKNKKKVIIKRSELIKQGYQPSECCNP